MLNIKIGEGLVGYSALHKVPLIVDDVSKDPRYIKVLEDVRSELVIPLMLEGPLHRRVRSRKPGAGRLQPAARRDPRHPREPGGRGDRERAVVRNREGQRASAGARDRVRAPRADGADAGRSAEAAEGGRSGRAVRAGAADWRRPLRFSVARSEHAGDRGRRRVRQRGSGGAVRSVRGRARAVPHVPAALHDDPVEPFRRARVDEHDPSRAAARGILLHAVLRVVRFQEAAARDRELRAAVSNQAQRGRLVADSASRRAAGSVSRTRPTKS